MTYFTSSVYHLPVLLLLCDMRLISCVLNSGCFDKIQHIGICDGVIGVDMISGTII
jgi:hypothetical protein